MPGAIDGVGTLMAVEFIVDSVVAFSIYSSLLAAPYSV